MPTTDVTALEDCDDVRAQEDNILPAKEVASLTQQAVVDVSTSTSKPKKVHISLSMILQKH